MNLIHTRIAIRVPQFTHATKHPTAYRRLYASAVIAISWWRRVCPFDACHALTPNKTKKNAVASRRSASKQSAVDRQSQTIACGPTEQTCPCAFPCCRLFRSIYFGPSDVCRQPLLLVRVIVIAFRVCASVCGSLRANGE